jgi:hypothetical protein
VDNALVVLLQGLQDIGTLMSIAAQDKKPMIEELKTVGFFIAAVGNLSEALNTLRLDASYLLQEHYQASD